MSLSQFCEGPPDGGLATNGSTGANVLMMEDGPTG
jgi:hypothetical protein